MCLTATEINDFSRIIYRNCTDGNSNQDFFLKQNGPLSGEIHTKKDTNYCLQMADPSPLKKHLPVYMHSDCSDTWEVLDGRLKNLHTDRCLGREEGSLRAVGVQCNSSIVESFSAFLGEPKCSKYETTGWHEGTYIEILHVTKAPNGYEWKWEECAQQCVLNSECEFWTLRLVGNKACILLKDQGEYNDARGHMEGSRNVECLNLTSSSPAPSSTHEKSPSESPTKLLTALPSPAPSISPSLAPSSIPSTSPS